MPLGVLTLSCAGLAIGWLTLWVVTWLRFRVRPLSPVPAHAALGPEPPAVVNLLTHRWRLTDDAAEATLLDLAARGLLHLHQPDPDPASTLIRLTTTNPGHLLPYEQRVLDWVRRQAGDGEVRLIDLGFPNLESARAWQQRFRHEVITDARARGLSRPRTAYVTAVLLAVVGGLLAVTVGLLLYRWRGDPTLAACAPVAVWLLTDPLVRGLASELTDPVARALTGELPDHPKERDTAAGRQVAARWLGVRQWLASRPGIADVPPAAVHDWDRYLAYGAALGLTRTTSTLLDQGAGDYRLLRAALTGEQRRAQLRHPSPGMLVQTLVPGAFLLVGLGAMVEMLSWTYPDPASADPALSPVEQDAVALVSGAVVMVLALSFGYVGFYLLRWLLDRLRQTELLGEVRWMRVGRTAPQPHGPPIPIVHHLGIEDPTADPASVWELPSEWATRVSPGDIVKARGRPWTREITELRVLERRCNDRPPPAPAAMVGPTSGGQPGGSPSPHHLPGHT